MTIHSFIHSCLTTHICGVTLTLAMNSQFLMLTIYQKSQQCKPVAILWGCTIGVVGAGWGDKATSPWC